MTRRYSAVVVVLVVCLLGGHARVSAEDDAQTFEGGLAKVQTTLKKGNHTSGLKALARLLEQHAEQSYVRARRAEIIDLAERLAFGAACPAPDPATVIEGKILKYDPKSGKIQIEYTPQTSLHLERVESLRYFPTSFTGPFSVVIEGRSFPAGKPPTILFGYVEHPKHKRMQSWQVDFGCPEFDKDGEIYTIPARMIYVDDDDVETLATRETCPAKNGASYKAELKVAKSRFSAKLNGKAIGKGKKHKAIFGLVGFEAAKWDKVTLSGPVEKAWIQSKLDVVMQKKRVEFQSTYDKAAHLPAWLFEDGPDARPVGDWAQFPGSPGADDSSLAKHTSLIAQALVAIALGNFADALDHVEVLRTGDAPATTCDYLEASAHLGAFDLAKAQIAISRCMKEEPGFLRGALVHGVVLTLLKKSSDARRAMKPIADADDVDPSEYGQLATMLLYAGRPQAAGQVTQIAAMHGVQSGTLEMLGTILRKATSGPTWSRSFEARSAHYHVVTDMDKETAREATEALEANYRIYQSELGLVKREKRKFTVFLFSGQAGFLAYLGEMRALWGGGTYTQAAGLYSPLLKQLLIWNLETRDDMMETIRHEGFHQFMDKALPGGAPTWLDEGMAVYYENARRVDGKLKTGESHHDYVKLLEEKDPLPLAEFIHIPHEKFYEGGHYSYAQAWLLVHLLRHGSSKERAIYKSLMGRLKSEPAAKILKELFSDEVLDRLDTRLASHLTSLGK